MFKGGKEPKFLELSSGKNNIKRYHTQQIKQHVDDLEEAERILNDAITPFIISLFTNFYEKNSHWSQVIRCLSELDCLHALADISS